MLMAIFLSNEAKIAKAQRELAHEEGDATTGINHMEILDMVVESNKKSIESYQSKLNYITKYQHQLQADINETFNWNHKGINYQYTLIPKEITNLPCGFQLKVGNQTVTLLPKYYDSKITLEYSYDNKNKQTDAIVESFIKSLYNDKHYLTTLVHFTSLGIPAYIKRMNANAIALGFEPADVEFNNLEDVKSFLVRKIAYNQSLTPQNIIDQKNWKVQYDQSMNKIDQANKKLNKAINPNPLGTLLAQLSGSKVPINKADLINLIRLDRFFLAWLILAIELAFLAVGVCIGLIVACFVFFRNKLG
jgi:hypothetical protein